MASPLLTVVIPVYNSSKELTRSLEALAGSKFDDFEVLVVDDGSTEPVEEIVSRRGYDYLRIEGPGGPARARNRGAQASRGRYLVFIDADVCVHPDTLSLIAERLASDPSIDAVIGSYDEEPADQSFISQYKNLFHHFVHQNHDGPIQTFWSGCGAIGRRLFIESGGFDEKRYPRPSIEDIELGTWLSAAGRRIILDSRIRVTHLKKWTLSNLLRTDIFDRGIPWTRLMLRAGSIANTLNVTHIQRMSVALVYMTMITGLASFRLPKMSVVAGLLALIVTGLNWDFYLFFARHKGWWFAMRVIPLHWLYFLYCGFSAAAGTIQHIIESRTEAGIDKTAMIKSPDKSI